MSARRSARPHHRRRRLRPRARAGRGCARRSSRRSRAPRRRCRRRARTARSQSSTSTAPAPSPITNPARVASNGREARGGYSSSAASPRIAVKPARISGSTQASVPPAITASQSPALDHLGGLADRVRPGRAGRDDRVVQALDPERDRDLAGRRVDEHVRQEARRDAVGAAVAQRRDLLGDPGHAADRRAEEHADPRRVEIGEAGVGERLLRDRDGGRARTARASARPSARRP